MEWHDMVNLKRAKALTGARWERGVCQQEEPVDYMGGIIHDGEWGWFTRRYAREATLQVQCLDSGARVASYTFWQESDSKDDDERSSISCVEELFTDQPGRPVLLAVGLESWNGGQRRPKDDQARSQVHLYCVTHYQVLRVLDIGKLLCRSLAYLDKRLCRATQLACYDGCLAAGTVDGFVLLIDLNYQRLLSDKRNFNPKQAPSALYRVPGNKRMRSFDDRVEDCRTNGMHLSVELDVAPVGIRCLVGLGLAPGFAAGLDDGRILIYDLVNFQLTVELRASKATDDLGRVERLCAIVPPDDPKPCFFICAIYRGPDRLTMLLHSINFTSVKQLHDGYHYENFYGSSVRNQQALDIGDCSVTGCSSVSTFNIAGDNGTLLALLSWRSLTERKNKFVLFDMNQWYKDEMPEGVKPGERPHYIVGYRLKSVTSGLAVLLRPSSILHFVALQRYEEHFYPNSLTFDLEVLTPEAWHFYTHDGVQRRFLKALHKEDATLFLRPQHYHENIVRLRLLPQFCELSPDAIFSKSAMYDVILSVALEHGFRALLNNCAISWLDGSFLCNMLDPTELSHATLTNWIMRRAGHIKSRISDICQGVFDYGGYTLDERERREFELLSDQMGELVGLQAHVLKVGRGNLTLDYVEQLANSERSLQIVNEYQKVLYWFIKQGLLPEGQNEPEQGEERQRQQKPLIALRRSFVERRKQRRRLYIDAMMKETWPSLDNAYPPGTLQALLYVMLDPDAELASKQKLVLYILLDLAPELAKRFPMAFRMDEPDVRSVNSFWWLDRGNYKRCMAELYDMRPNPPTGFSSWEVRLLVETLLEAADVKAAMRVVCHPPGPVTSTLQMDVLLANNCIPAAFHNARLALDERGKPLVERFFRRCIHSRLYKVLSGLCLTDGEEQMLYRLLQENPSHERERVQLVMLLLKSRYIEATNFMDAVAERRQRAYDNASVGILSAYRSTMTPVTQNIAGTYFRLRGRLDEDLASGPNAEHRMPLSTQLARQNSRGHLGDIFHSCTVSALWAEHRPLPDNSPPFSMQTNGNGNIPFLRTESYGFSNAPQPGHVVRPELPRVSEKRQREPEAEAEAERDGEPASSMQPRKRLRLEAEQVMGSILENVTSLLVPQPNLEQSREQVRASDLVQAPTFLQPRSKQPAAPSPAKIPAILKRRPVAEVATPPTATSTSLSQPKSFRFKSPIPLRVDSSLAMERENEVPEEAEEEEEETDEIIMEIESRSQPRSAYNTESDEEEEVFLSPLTTATVPRTSRLSGEAAETKTKPSPSLRAPPAGPQPRGSLVQSRAGTRIGSVTGRNSSSGFGSFGTVQPAQTTSRSHSHSQFVPTVCSSKMYETQSQSQSRLSSAGSSMAKISERTTICGDMESTDLVASMAATASSQWSMPPARLSGQNLRMMDTTLDMSTSLEQRGGLDPDPYPDRQDITDLVLAESEDEEGDQQAQSPSSPSSESEGSGRSSPEMRHQRTSSRSNSEASEDEEKPGHRVARPSSESSFSDGVDMSGLLNDSDEEAENMDMQTYDEQEDGEQPEGEQDEGEQDDGDKNYEEHDGGDQENAVTERSQPGYQQMTYFGAASQQAPVQAPVLLPASSSRSESSELSSPERRPQRQEVELASSNDDEESTGSITTSRSVTHTPEGTFLPSDTNVSQTSSPRAPHGPGGDGSPRSLYRANSLETIDEQDTTKGSLVEEEEDDEDDCVIALDGTEVRGYVARPQQATTCSSAELFAFKDECADEAAPGPGPSLSLGATVNSDSVVAADIIDLDSVEEDEQQLPQSQLQQQETQDMQQILEIQNIDNPMTGVDEEPEVELVEQQEVQAAAEADISIAQQDENSRQSLTLAFSDDEADKEVAAASAVFTPRRSLRARRNSAESHQDSPTVRRPRLRSDDSDGGAPYAVTTPKRRALKHKLLLEVIDEQGSLDTSPQTLTRSRSRLASVDTDAETPKRFSTRMRANSLAPLTGGRSVESPIPRRSTRGVSEPANTPRRSTRGFSKSPTQTPTKPTAEPKPVRILKTRSRKNSSNDISPAVSPAPSDSEQPRLRRTTRRRNSEVSETGSTNSGGNTRELRSLRRPVSTDPEARPPSRSSQKASRTPTPTEASSEAHVPPKKRGRPKNYELRSGLQLLNYDNENTLTPTASSEAHVPPKKRGRPKK